jgi:hypothetical protein
MVHWKSYLASFLLVLTAGLLWLFATTGPTQQQADAGVFRQMRENRQARRAARWERIQAWHQKHFYVPPTPQPQPQPQPQPIPPIPPLPPAPIPEPPKTDPALPVARVLVLYDPNWLSTADPKQAAILTDPGLFAYLNGKYPHNYRFYASTADPAAMLPAWQALYNTAAAEKHPLQTPWLWMFDPAGKELLSEALPGTAAQTLTDLKKTGGN